MEGKRYGNNCNFIQIFKANLHQPHCFLLIYLCFFQLQKTHHKLIFYEVFKLDTDPHWGKLLDLDMPKNECGSTALQVKRADPAKFRNDYI